ncbi:hypothetical protein PNI0212_02124 [Streptococcus pneumoniae PNI0212]|nr:hypothetical protein PNI0212_02124 [Streptococcus pneumoniae PNI0212]
MAQISILHFDFLSIDKHSHTVFNTLRKSLQTTLAVLSNLRLAS